MKRILLAIAVIALLVGLAIAAPPEGEVVISADGGHRFIGGNGEIGHLDALADGTAKLWLFSVVDDAMTIRWPRAASSDSGYSLRASQPRPFGNLSGSAIDSVYIDLDGATEVILTW